MIEIRDDPDESRFEVLVDGSRAGFARYSRHPGRIFFVHTEVDPQHEGEGLGSRLAAGALDAVRQTGELVVPLCPFVARFIERHADEYGDLVDRDLLARIATAP